MPETLISPSQILLFGRVVEDLQIKSTASDATGSTGHLEQQLRAPDANFARIYGFGHEGHFHLLTGTALFLVHGSGEAAGQALAELKLFSPDPAEKTATSDLPLPQDLSVWIYDKADFTVRMDVRTGMFDQLLVSTTCGPVVGMSAHGMSVPFMGAVGMSAEGMSVRGMSAPGMSAHFANTGGMSVQGMSVGGMSVGGMSAGGMSAQSTGSGNKTDD
ncbi:hypothetical protein [Paracoccus aestuariivivens]|uniref:hypothetical protein n=1 Tax=Paracoccus aestuariivivens TaxID=1820333 RepID=UPI001B8D704E|nr:hypothetical protein [Paracoccus aestuariivivens]